MPAAKIIPIGSRYGNLTTISEPFAGMSGKWSVRFVWVRCDCGSEYPLRVGSSGNRGWGSAKSCLPCSAGRKQIPAGSRHGQLTTLGEVFSEKKENRNRKISQSQGYIKVRCDCGEEYDLAYTSWGKRISCKNCVPKRRVITDEDYARPPAFWRDELYEQQDGFCAWPLCEQALIRLSETGHVDHNKRVSPGNKTIRRAVRGLVHPKCNIYDILAADWALDHGWTAPSIEVDTYLRQGEFFNGGGLPGDYL